MVFHAYRNYLSRELTVEEMLSAPLVRMMVYLLSGLQMLGSGDSSLS